MSPKTVLITGCSAGGIGASLVQAFQASGYSVFVTARTPSKMDKALLELPGVRSLTLDVTDVQQTRQAVADVALITGGKLDVLVNNAGCNYTMPLLDCNIEDGKRLFDANFWGVLQVTQAFAALLASSQGRVVNISSIASVLNTPWMGLYGASKAAVASMSETLRLEMGPLGVKVMTVMAGNVETKFWDNGTEFSLPPRSLYAAIGSTIADAASGKQAGKQTTPARFAREIVEAVDAGNHGIVWKGALAGSVKWVVRLMPTWMVDKALLSGRGLDAPLHPQLVPPEERK